MGVTRLFRVCLIFRMIGFLYPTIASGYYGLRIRYGRGLMRLPLHSPNASSLVDFLFHKVNPYYPFISKALLLRLSFLTLIRVMFFLLPRPSVGIFLISTPVEVFLLFSFLFFWKRKEKSKQGRKESPQLRLFIFNTSPLLH